MIVNNDGWPTFNFCYCYVQSNTFFVSLNHKLLDNETISCWVYHMYDVIATKYAVYAELHQHGVSKVVKIK